MAFGGFPVLGVVSNCINICTHQVAPALNLCRIPPPRFGMRFDLFPRIRSAAGIVFYFLFVESREPSELLEASKICGSLDFVFEFCRLGCLRWRMVASYMTASGNRPKI